MHGDGATQRTDAAAVARLVAGENAVRTERLSAVPDDGPATRVCEIASKQATGEQQFSALDTRGAAARGFVRDEAAPLDDGVDPANNQPAAATAGTAGHDREAIQNRAAGLSGIHNMLRVVRLRGVPSRRVGGIVSEQIT